MTRMIQANFFRIIHSKVFWGCSLLLLAFSLMQLFFGYRNALGAYVLNASVHVDDTWFSLTPFMGAFQAIFVSFFIGSEMSDRTVRNKIIAGYSRTKIYLANWISAFLVGLFFILIWYLSQLPGFFVISPLYMSVEEFFLYTIMAVLMMASFTSLYVFVCMITSRLSSALLVNLVLFLVMTGVAAHILDRLNSPEMIGGMAYVDGEFIMEHPTPNPYHPTGLFKTILETIYTLLPAGLAITLARSELADPLLSGSAALLFSLGFTLAGIYLFQKRNIR